MLGDILRAINAERKPKDDGAMLYAICGVLLWVIPALAWCGLISIIALAIWKLLDLATYLGAW
jgi:hypothetical protein